MKQDSSKTNSDAQNQLPKHLHVIGICGVATSALAIAFHERGVKVTGSDKGFFPPVSTELEKHKIDFYAGWHPEKMTAESKPDVVMIGAASGSQNPETIYAKENNIPQYSYPEMIGKFFAKEKSIVCSGTWGKTSSSTLLSFILSEAGLDPSYMFGGVSLSHNSSAKLTDSKWSVFEGDEYKSSPTDSRAKFFHYKPTNLMLSAVSWDHADLYPTEELYYDAFHKLMKIMPNDGFVVGCADHPGVMKVLKDYNGKKFLYGKDANADYSYGDINQTQKGIGFTIKKGNESWQINSPMLGAYQAENMTGCFAMASELGIDKEKIISAIAKFKGLKRRLEKRLEGQDSKSGITVFDDIAHSPEKSASVISTLKNIFNGKITIVFEPNIGGRSRESAQKYDNAFRQADEVVIPRLTKLKVAEDGSAAPMEGDELANTIAKTHNNVKFIDDDAELVGHLVSNSKKGDVIAFLGSHGFRGMIEDTVSKLG